jgi:hypothetical protein
MLSLAGTRQDGNDWGCRHRQTVLLQTKWISHKGEVKTVRSWLGVEQRRRGRVPFRALAGSEERAAR